jgi:hypothetical protein
MTLLFPLRIKSASAFFLYEPASHSLEGCSSPFSLGSSSSRFFKANFDVAVRDSFSVAAGVICDSSGSIIFAATLKLPSTDALLGEASAALLASRLASSAGLDNISLEGDSLLVSLALNSPSLFSSWNFCNLISDTRLVLDSFHSWNAVKVSRSANFRAHALAKWAASNRIFGSIPKGSPILSSLRIQSGKDPPM